MLALAIQNHRRATQETMLASGRLLRANRSVDATEAADSLHIALRRLNQAVVLHPPPTRPSFFQAPRLLRAPRVLPPPAPTRLAAPRRRPPAPLERREHALVQQEIRGVKGLLLEIIKRAAHDWVLYKLHRDLQLRQLAEDAFVWLFEEEEGHPNWIERTKADRQITSFVMICEMLDINVDAVRQWILRLTAQDVRNAGRPKEQRSRRRLDALAEA